MKKILFVCLLLLAGCQKEEQPDNIYAEYERFYVDLPGVDIPNIDTLLFEFSVRPVGSDSGDYDIILVTQNGAFGICSGEFEDGESYFRIPAVSLVPWTFAIINNRTEFYVSYPGMDPPDMGAKLQITATVTPIY